VTAYDLGGPAIRFLDSVESVTIKTGHIPSDPTVWCIQIAGKCVEVDAEKMDRNTTFRKQYLKMFHRLPPLIKSDEWLTVVDVLSESAEVITAKEESERVYIANQVMEDIRRMPVTEEQEDAATGRALIQRGEYLCLRSNKMKDIAESYHIAPNILSKTMTELGYKAEGTEPFRCNKHLYRFWWFRKDAIEYMNPHETIEETKEGGM